MEQAKCCLAAKTRLLTTGWARSFGSPDKKNVPPLVNRTAGCRSSKTSGDSRFCILFS